jgi:RNA polymerase sigma-70 factor (ECF subfamily)
MRASGQEEGDTTAELQRIDSWDTLMTMPTSAAQTATARLAVPTDSEIVGRVRAGEHALFEVLMRRHNQRIYRAARAVIKDEAEVEDVMQQSYINAFTHLHQFEDRSEFSTWLTRITLNEAFARRKKMKRAESLTAQAGDEAGVVMETIRSAQPDPERQAYAQELGRVREHAGEELPESYRTVFMLRDVEGLSTSETSAGLGIGDEAVKTRLHRARAMIRRSVTERLGALTGSTFQFQAPRCDRVVAAVLEQILVR